jgi:hypothetical protein
LHSSDRRGMEFPGTGLGNEIASLEYSFAFGRTQLFAALLDEAH